MATGAMFIRWGATVRGRETKALEVFGRALELAEKETKAGRLHGHKEYFSILGQADGMQGFQILEGELETLTGLVVEDEWRDVLIQAGQICENFNVGFFQGGSDQSVQEGMGRFVNQLGELGYL